MRNRIALTTWYTPIGALTSKTYSFRSRPWELKTFESIDLTDALGSNIKISYKGSNILRILPSLNEYINEEWITDKARFSYDSLNRWRFTTPIIKNHTTNQYTQQSWDKIFKNIRQYIDHFNIQRFESISGPYSSLETLFSIRNMLDALGKVNYSQTCSTVSSSSYNQNLAKSLLTKDLLDRPQQVYIFINLNLRIENPILNLKFRRLSKTQKILIGYFGHSHNTNVYMHHLGVSTSNLQRFLTGQHWFSSMVIKFCRAIPTAGLNFIIADSNRVRKDYFSIFSSLKEFTRLSTFLSSQIFILHNYPGYVNAAAMDFSHTHLRRPNTVFYFLGSINLKFTRGDSDLLIFQGHHQDQVLKEFDIILPSTAPYETDSLHLNCFNILQRSQRLPFLLKQVREEWQIALLFQRGVLMTDPKYQSQQELNRLIQQQIGYQQLNYPFTVSYQDINLWTYRYQFNNSIFEAQQINYYLDTPFTRASKIMMKCSQEFIDNRYIYLTL